MRCTMKRAVLLFWMLLVSIPVCSAGPAHKPLPPLTVSIVPAQPGLTPANIKPGGAVEFRVVARSLMEARQMDIRIELTSGAELVSGDRAWSGPMTKGGEKAINIVVRAPKKGTGRIKARVSISGAHGASFVAESQYLLGIDTGEQASPKPPVKRDSRGRKIIEYR